MTHSLHRLGSLEDLRDDFVVLIMAGGERIKNELVRERMQEVWDILSQCRARLANVGTLMGGGPERPISSLKAKDPWIIHAVFSSRADLASFLREMQARDLGISVTVSGCREDAFATCTELGLTPHTAQHSLGIHGRKDKLPDETILAVATMCGHSMVSANLIRHVLGRIAEGKMTHAQGAEELSRMCDCGIFNRHKAERLLRQLA